MDTKHLHNFVIVIVYYKQKQRKVLRFAVLAIPLFDKIRAKQIILFQCKK